MDLGVDSRSQPLCCDHVCGQCWVPDQHGLAQFVAAQVVDCLAPRLIWQAALIQNSEMTTRTIAIERYVVQSGGMITPCALRPRPDAAADETAVIFRRRRRDSTSPDAIEAPRLRGFKLRS